MDVTTSTSLNDAAPAPPGSDRFRRLARALRVPAQDIEDVVPQAWLRILENRARVGLASDTPAYVGQIVRNEARTSRWRARRRENGIHSVDAEQPRCPRRARRLR